MPEPTTNLTPVTCDQQLFKLMPGASIPKSTGFCGGELVIEDVTVRRYPALRDPDGNLVIRGAEDGNGYADSHDVELEARTEYVDDEYLRCLTCGTRTEIEIEESP